MIAVIALFIAFVAIGIGLCSGPTRRAIVVVDRFEPHDDGEGQLHVHDKTGEAHVVRCLNLNGRILQRGEEIVVKWRSSAIGETDPWTDLATAPNSAGPLRPLPERDMKWVVVQVFAGVASAVLLASAWYFLLSTATN